MHRNPFGGRAPPGRSGDEELAGMGWEREGEEEGRQGREKKGR